MDSRFRTLGNANSRQSERNPFTFGNLGQAGRGGVSIDYDLIPAFDALLQSSTVPVKALGSSTPTFTRATPAYVLAYDSAAVLGVDDPIMLLCASGEARFMGARRVSEGVWSGLDANGVALTTTNGASSLCCDASGPFGYLAEGARADVLGVTTAIRRTMTDVGWVSGGGGITVGAAVGADGVANAGASLTATGANGTILFTTVLGAAVRTYSAFVRRKTGTGTVNITGDNGVTWTPITLTTAYKLFQFTTASAANPVVGFRIVTDTDAIEVDFNTLEAATFANPTPIPVNVSKAADVLTYLSAGNISVTQGSAYAEVVPFNLTASNFNIIGTVSNQGVLLVRGSTQKAAAYLDPAFADGPSVLSTTAVNKVASSWTISQLVVATAGSIGTPENNPNSGAFTAIGIGTNVAGAAQLFGTLRNIRIYLTTLSASRLEVLTTP